MKFFRLLRRIYADLGFDTFEVNFADRPAQRAGDDSVWERAEGALREACEKAEVKWTLNAGEGAFYGPKLEFVLKDAIGRRWQCGTWQVDFVLPERLDAEYTDANGQCRRPVMCHRAIIGSLKDSSESCWNITPATCPCGWRLCKLLWRPLPPMPMNTPKKLSPIYKRPDCALKLTCAMKKLTIKCVSIPPPRHRRLWRLGGAKPSKQRIRAALG